MSQIHLCSIPELNKDYKNVYDFISIEREIYFMDTKWVLSVDTNAKIDNFTQSITINRAMDTQLRKCDYLYTQATDGKYYFFFIDNMEVLSPSTVKLHLTLDVWNTYQLDIQLLPSYVVRQHVPRWNADGTPTKEIIEEGSSGKYELKRVSVVGNSTSEVITSKGVYIFYTSTPIGTVGCEKEGSGGDVPPKPNSCQADGILSYDGFRFIKGYEGFTPTGAYLNGESFRTVGYGFTETSNHEGYEAHKPFPCTEQKASELFGDLVDSYAEQVWQQCQADGIAELLTKSMFDAMVSTAWNCGVGGFLTYDSSPYQLIKVNPFDSNIENVWKNFAVTSQGNVLEGLVLRRQAEVDIYFRNDYEMRTIINTEGGIVNGDGFIPERYVKCEHSSRLVEIEDELGNIGMFPCASGRFTNVYPNYNDGTYHGGIDLSGNNGVNIYPPRDNMTVVKVVGGYPNERNDSLGYGNYCVLEDNETKLRYWFGHMRATPLVKEGEIVNQKNVLGFVGTSGYSTGAHLHYEIRVSPYDTNMRINPIKYIYNSDGTKHEPSINETFTRGELI